MEVQPSTLSVAFDHSLIRRRNRALGILLDIGRVLLASRTQGDLLDVALESVLKHFPKEIEGKLLKKGA